ncbi:MAG: amino acid ABC transporter permease [Chloroflexi bacterium]|nr:amino acid ABC transporter permease [Chloroflexota bacterium]
MPVPPKPAVPPGIGAGGYQPRAPSRWQKFDQWWLLFAAAVLLVATLVLAVPEPYHRIFVFLLDGVVVTLRLTVESFFCILVVGIIGGLGRVSSSRILSGLASLYVEVVRGIPVLVWLLWIWFALPQVFQAVGQALLGVSPEIGNAIMNVKLGEYTAAITGFTFAYGAYMTEVFRAGIQSIAKGQMEAARSLGMNYLQAMRYIILPQAVRVILPPVSNEFVTLLKDSSLVSILAVSDLTRRGREFVAKSFLSFDTFTMVALIYLILTVFFTRVSTGIERRLSVEKR